MCILCIGCVDGDIRLQGGPSENVGRLEICIFNTWGTVCDDTFVLGSAQVVCRQLGYNIAGSQPLYEQIPGIRGPIFLDSIRCVGDESRLLDCPYNSIESGRCDHSEDIGVRCVGPHGAVATPMEQ